MKRAFLFVCLLTLLLLNSACGTQFGETLHTGSPIPANSAVNSTAAISQIYYYYMNIGFTQDEYKIDLVNDKFYQFHTNHDIREIRDTKAANEGYQEVADLTVDKVASFLKKARKYDFASWKESYINGYDGYWGFEFTFSDGTKKDVEGNFDYPKTWDDFREGLKELTGVEVIGERVIR